MKASCLINNYNYAHFITEAIESALNQTYPFYEIVIVDDGSIDESVQLVKKYQERYPQIKPLEQANSGQLSCFNQGFLKSSGDIIDLLRNRLEGHQIDDCSNKIDSYSESISTVSVFG